MKPRSSWSIAWLLSYISIASVSAAMITPALPQIQAQFALDAGTVEWLVSSFLLGYVLGQLIYAPLANAFGRLKSLRLGLFINLIGIFVCMLAINKGLFWGLIVGRFLTGLGAAAGLACTFMIINEWLSDDQKKTAMAYSILSFALGIGLAVMIGALITEYISWHACFIILLIQGLCMLLGVQVFDETLIHARPFNLDMLLQGYGQALKSPLLIIFSLVVGSCSMIGYCFSAAGPQIAQYNLHLSVSAYGYWNILNIIGMLIGGLSSKILMHRLSAEKLISYGFAGLFFTFASLFALWHWQLNSVLGFFLCTSLLYWFSSYLFAGGSYLASNAIADRANASAMMSFINMSFATLSVILMSYIKTDFFCAFLLTIGVLSSSVALLFSLTIQSSIYRAKMI